MRALAAPRPVCTLLPTDPINRSTDQPPTTQPPQPQFFAVHPGMVLTDVVRSLPAPVVKAYRAVMRLLLLTPTEGEGLTRPGLPAHSRGQWFLVCLPLATALFHNSNHTGGSVWGSFGDEPFLCPITERIL
jgi:hypothetical protein